MWWLDVQTLRNIVGIFIPKHVMVDILNYYYRKETHLLYTLSYTIELVQKIGQNYYEKGPNFRGHLLKSFSKWKKKLFSVNDRRRFR